MKKPRAIALSAFLAVAFVVTASSADPTPAQPTRNEDGYQYYFGDDPLRADGLGPLGARIAVVARVTRETLIRPRTVFVVEMLKSVEVL
jgi:hypothetical protein